MNRYDITLEKGQTLKYEEREIDSDDISGTIDMSIREDAIMFVVMAESLEDAISWLIISMLNQITDDHKRKTESSRVMLDAVALVKSAPIYTYGNRVYGSYKGER